METPTANIVRQIRNERIALMWHLKYTCNLQNALELVATAEQAILAIKGRQFYKPLVLPEGIVHRGRGVVFARDVYELLRLDNYLLVRELDVA